MTDRSQGPTLSVREAAEPANLRVYPSQQESSASFDISDPEVVRMLEESHRTHFWFAARNRQILAFLEQEAFPPPAKILEIGCGAGTVLRALVEAGYQVTGVEMHIRLARRAAAENPSSRIYVADIRNPPSDLESDGPFDAVAMFDVLEHLDEPEGLLRSCAGLLRPGGSLVGTLPALQMLWSDYDSYAGHRRRFDRNAIRALFASAGLPKPRTAYFFQTMLPPMWLQRTLVGRRGTPGADARRAAQHRALDTPSRPLNSLLGSLCGAERALRRLISLDLVPGTSLWFSTRIADPGSLNVETPPRLRTDGGP